MDIQDRADLLRKLSLVDELLCSEDKWTKGANARDSFGGTCTSNDEHACKWCLVGAAGKVEGWAGMADRTLERTAEQLFPDRAVWRPGTRPLASFNDDPNTTFADVKKVIAKAMELVKERA